MSQQQQSPEGLEALLDEALEEFDTSLPARQSAASGAPSEAIAREEAGGPAPPASAWPDTEPASSQPAAGLPLEAAPPKSGAGRGLAFNPLGPRPAAPKRGGPAARSGTDPASQQEQRRRQQQQQGTAQEEEGEEGESDEEGQHEALRAAAAAAGLGGLGDLGDVGDLSEGLSKLLAELANVDDETLAQVAADVAGAGAGGEHAQRAQRAQQQGDLASTLRALAEQAPSFGGAGGEGTDPLQQLGDHPEMASLVDSIMQQLLSKDVLYQPMKDIGTRYPAWLDANRGTLPEGDYTRYARQYEYIQQICALYESEPSDYAQLVNLLQQMQQCGQPPQEIVEELAPGMQFDAEGLPRFPGGAGSGAGAGGAGADLPPELAECCVM